MSVDSESERPVGLDRWGSAGAEVEFGLILALTIRGLALGDYEQMRRVAHEAEELGFDSVWLCDHFLTIDPTAYADELGLDSGDGADAAPVGPATMPLLECWTALSALSRDTERLGLGTSVLCNSYRSPSVLAKMAATLDVISGGRVQLGLGAGWFREEYEAYGIPFPRAGVRVAQLAEAVDVIQRMWREPNPTFEGEHYRIDGAVCDPPPAQPGGPPIWIGGEGDKVHRLAATSADGVNTRWWSPQGFVDRADYLDKAAAEVGRDPASLRRSATLLLLPGTDREAHARQRARFDAIPETGIVVGTPEECADRITAYVDAGVRHFLFTIPDVADLDQLRLAGREVLPLVRERCRAT